MQLVKNNLLFISFLLLSSCFFGPFKEINNQIEDSWSDSNSYINNPTPLKEFNQLIDIKINKVYDFGLKSNKNFKNIILDPYFYSISTNGSIQALNIIENKLFWNYKHSNEIVAGLALNQESLFFVDNIGYLNAIDSKNGTLQWKVFVGEVFSPPLSYDRSVLVKSTNGKVFSINTLDGSYQWNYQLPASNLIIKSWGELVGSDNKIFIGSENGKIICLDFQNGTLIWETTFSQPKGTSELDRSNAATSTPILDDISLYVVSVNGNLSSISKTDGSIYWSRPLSSFYGMTSSLKSLYVTHNSGAIYRIEKDTSTVIWRNADLLGRDVSKPIMYLNYAIVSDYEGYLHFLDIENGTLVGRAKLSDYQLLINPNNIIHDKLLISNLEGELFLISLENMNTIELTNIYDTKNEDATKNSQDEKNTDDSFIDELFFWR